MQRLRLVSQPPAEVTGQPAFASIGDRVWYGNNGNGNSTFTGARLVFVRGNVVGDISMSRFDGLSRADIIALASRLLDKIDAARAGKPYPPPVLPPSMEEMKLDLEGAWDGRNIGKMLGKKSTGIASRSGSDTAGAESSLIFYTTVPRDIQDQLHRELAAVAQRTPYSPQQKTELVDLIATLHKRQDLTWSKTRDVLGRGGLATTPVIAEQLVSQDAKVRNNALEALRMLIKPPSEKPKDYRPTENILILLLRRSSLDADCEVRRTALGSLSMILLYSTDGVPAGISQTLADAELNDPDANIREFVNCIRQDRGLIPRDPDRTDIAD